MAPLIRQLYKPFLLLLCVLILGTWVCAAACSVQVLLKDGDTPVEDISVELCQVAAVQDGALVLTGDYAQLGLTPEHLSQCQPEDAEQVYQYTLSRELEGMVSLTGSRGEALFSPLSEGIWLVFERGNQMVAFPPYLICLPTEHGGQLLYSVNSAPKLITSDSRSLMVFVEWDDEDDAAGHRPDFVEVTLYRNGAPIRKVILDADCHWQHTFSLLPGEGEYTVEQSNVRYYTSTCVPVAEGFLLPNVYKGSSGGGTPGPGPNPPKPPVMPPTEPSVEPEAPPSEPIVPVPTLPQTGHNLFPVLFLLSLGPLLVLLGLTLICLGGKKS